MKLQIDYPLIETIRNAPTHRIPKNFILQLLIYVVVFFVMQIAEVCFMLPSLIGNLMTWGAEHTQATSDEITQYIDELMMQPENVRAMLFSTAAGTVVVLLYCRLIEGRRLDTLGFTKHHIFSQYLLGLLAGFVVFSAVVGLSFLFGGLQYNGYVGNFGLNLFLLFIGFLLQGMSEEVLCRGFIMTSGLRHHGLWWAVGINSLLFGLMHNSNAGFTLFALLNLVLYAVMISLYALRTNNLWGACAFHSIWNFSQGNFYGLPVSGINVGDTVFTMSLKGSDFVNGGAFGLEASIATTIVMVICIAVLLFVPNPFAKKQEEATV